MSAILVVKSLDLALALRNKTKHPDAIAILAELQKSAAELDPFLGISGVDPYVKYFWLKVPDDERDTLLAHLRRLPGVSDAFVKQLIERI